MLELDGCDFVGFVFGQRHRVRLVAQGYWQSFAVTERGNGRRRTAPSDTVITFPVILRFLPI